MRKLTIALTTLATTLAVAAVSPAALALNIPFGPVQEPPGAGAEIPAGDAALSFLGADINYIGIDLSRTEELYFGVRNDTLPNAFSADGLTFEPNEILRFQTSTPNSITYTAETTIQTDAPNPGTWTLPVVVTYTFTGPGEVVADVNSINLNNDLGDVTALWRVEGDFAVNVKVQVQITPLFDANFGGFEPANFFFNRTPSRPSSPPPPFGNATATSYDWGF